jgi:hypothetical protein
MENIDRERLVELMIDRDEAVLPARSGAYWQGRIDEYVAQNAIGAGDVALCEAEAKA